MDRILGQTHAIDLIQQALQSGRVHHAWIFSGPRGVGKHTTAVEFARVLLDPGAGPNLMGLIEADPQGRTSHLIDREAHPDLHLIRKELALFSENPQLRSRRLRNIPIDLLREHMIGGTTQDGRRHDAAAYLTPVEGHAKVFIIDEAELLDQVAQNALLKTLEEPPRRTYLILVTTRPDRLYPTIRSRCQHVRFAPLDHEAMAAWFETASLDLDDAQRQWIEEYSEGSPGTALLAAEYGFHSWHHQLAPLLEQAARGIFPVELGASMSGLIEEFAEAWLKQHTNASKDAANKDGVRHVLFMLAAHARRQLSDRLQRDEDPQPSLEMIDLLREAEYEIETNVNMKLALENLSVQMARATA